MENVYYWYDGNIPYFTDATALRLDVPGYFYVDNYGATQVNASK